MYTVPSFVTNDIIGVLFTQMLIIIQIDTYYFGQEVDLPEGTCALIASSKMGLTVFDLLDEIFDENDVREFLNENNIQCLSYGPRALIARLITFFMSVLGRG